MIFAFESEGEDQVVGGVGYCKRSPKNKNKYLHFRKNSWGRLSVNPPGGPLCPAFDGTAVQPGRGPFSHDGQAEDKSQDCHGRDPDLGHRWTSRKQAPAIEDEGRVPASKLPPLRMKVGPQASFRH